MSAKRKHHPGGDWWMKADWNFSNYQYEQGNQVSLRSVQGSVVDEFHIGEWLHVSAFGGRTGYQVSVGIQDQDDLVDLNVSWTKDGIRVTWENEHPLALEIKRLQAEVDRLQAALETSEARY